MKNWFIEWARKPANVMNAITFSIIVTVGYYFSIWMAIPMFALLLVSIYGPI